MGKAPTNNAAIDIGVLAANVATLSTQVKIMWGIGAAIIVLLAGGAWTLNSTLNELNRSIGLLQGEVHAGTESSKAQFEHLQQYFPLLKSAPGFIQKGELGPSQTNAGFKDQKAEYMDAPKKN